ncbi:MAG: T9SS type A sorting domain-containing protein [Bacteroidota bacterium]
MKKILLSSMLAFSVCAIAQNKTVNVTPGKHIHSFKKTDVAAYKNLQSNASKPASQTGSAWLNKIDYIDFIASGSSLQVISAMHLFPDSTIILGYDSGNQPVYPWVHKAANYVDPQWHYQQSVITDTMTPYNLDSVSVGYLYERNTGASDNTADSLIIQVIAENTGLNYTLTGPPAFPYQDIEFNFATQNLKPSMTVLKRLSIPLTWADTCMGGVYKQILAATPGIAIQANGKKIGTVISFKPGYTFTTTDVLIGDVSNPATKNAFFMLTSEENGASTDPTYNGVANDYTSDMNMSYILDQSVRYNQNTNGWNGYFLPTFAYTTPFAYEHHDIGYKVRVTITGVKELEQKGFALGQNVPNPYTQASVVEFELTKDANSAVFTVTDVTGRVVSSEKVSSNVGKHSVSLGAYAAGVYYYSLNVDGNITTKKLVVQ